MRQPPTDENTLSGWSESQSCLAIGNATSLPNTNSPSVTVQLIKSSHCEIPFKKGPLQNLRSVFHIVGKVFIDKNTHKQCYLCFPSITINGWSTCKISRDQDIKLHKYHKSYITNVNLWFFNIKLPNIFVWFLLDVSIQPPGGMVWGVNPRPGIQSSSPMEGQWRVNPLLPTWMSMEVVTS